MPDRGERGAKRTVLYCVVPRELAAKLHEPLRRHFREDPQVEVVVERRGQERRQGAERRSGEGEPYGRSRAIRNPGGRRVAERRAPFVDVAFAAALPRRARAHLDKLSFVERAEPPSEHLEDVDTGRLVTRIQAGDAEAFSDLYLRYFDRVYGYLLVVLNNAHTAEDASQHVFMRLLEALPAYERRGPFNAWLFTIVRNHVLTVLRREGRLEHAEPAELDRSREAPALGDEGLMALQWISDGELKLFIDRLPRPQQQILFLRFMVGLTTQEIAQVVGSNPDAIRRSQSRALAFLRDRLAAVGWASTTRDERSKSLAPIRQALVVRARRYALVLPGPAR